VRIKHGAAGAVVDRRFDVLDKRPVAPDIQGLCPVADGEDWLVEIECVLQHELINGCTSGIGFATLWNWFFAILLWVDIITASREQNSLNSTEQLDDTVLTLVEGDDDGNRPDRVEGGKIRRQ
jgi:hypothetical protein